MERTGDAESTGSHDELLLAFLREHDAACPMCGYNLRALTRPVCPECQHELVLRVGAMRLRMGWLFVAVMPGFFSGVAAGFLLVLVIVQILFGGIFSPTVIVTDLFGWCSGIFAVTLAVKHKWFLSQARWRQQWMAIAIWVVHALALAMLIGIGPRYF